MSQRKTAILPYRLTAVNPIAPSNYASGAHPAPLLPRFPAFLIPPLIFPNLFPQTAYNTATAALRKQNQLEENDVSELTDA